MKETWNRGIKYGIEIGLRKASLEGQNNEHNALSDAKWNFELYKFLNKLCE